MLMNIIGTAYVVDTVKKNVLGFENNKSFL